MELHVWLAEDLLVQLVPLLGRGEDDEHVWAPFAEEFDALEACEGACAEYEKLIIISEIGWP